jgi:hypothetical protein
VSLVASLFQHLHGLSRDRLLNKFAENDCEKLDRLLELHFAYAARVAAGDRALSKQREVRHCVRWSRMQAGECLRELLELLCVCVCMSMCTWPFSLSLSLSVGLSLCICVCRQ